MPLFYNSLILLEGLHIPIQECPKLIAIHIHRNNIQQLISLIWFIWQVLFSFQRYSSTLRQTGLFAMNWMD